MVIKTPSGQRIATFDDKRDSFCCTKLHILETQDSTYRGKMTYCPCDVDSKFILKDINSQVVFSVYAGALSSESILIDRNINPVVASLISHWYTPVPCCWNILDVQVVVDFVKNRIKDELGGICCDQIEGELGLGEG